MNVNSRTRSVDEVIIGRRNNKTSFPYPNNECIPQATVENKSELIIIIEFSWLIFNVLFLKLNFFSTSSKEMHYLSICFLWTL